MQPDRAEQEQVPQAATLLGKTPLGWRMRVCPVHGPVRRPLHDRCPVPDDERDGAPESARCLRRCDLVELFPVEAAYPAIRQQVLREVEEALTSFDAIHALYCHLPTITTDNDAGPNDQEETDLIEAMRAALATLKDQDHVDEERGPREQLGDLLLDQANALAREEP